MTFTIAIAGRPNVGKSTLYNRLVGKRMAIVSDESGVTRDWREGDGSLLGLKFKVYDTAGLEDQRPKGSLAERTAARTKEALKKTDVILLVVDGRLGITNDDKVIAREIRKTGKPIILIANKCEGTYLPDTIDEMGALGFGDPVALSAAHGEGLNELHEALVEHVPDDDDDEAEDAVEDGDEERNLHVAIVGRPNAGKSTLLNRLIGEERMLVGPEAGLTRDSIPVQWKYRDKNIRLVDTAGLRRRTRVTAGLERLSTQETIRSIRLAHVVVLVIDAMQPFDKQDLVIARHVADEGRGLVIAVNKWDTVTDKKLVTKNLRLKADASLAQVAGVPLVPISALIGDGTNELMKAVLRIYETWNLRISTGKLNRWLEGMESENPPPITSGRRIKLRYMTQVKARPPTFSLWVNKPIDLPESYQRFLTNGLRRAFKFEGVPIRWQMKKSENPYEDKKK